MKARAATSRPGPCTPIVRHRASTPDPAMKRMAPTQSRSPTQRGIPSAWTAQKKGPMGQR